MELCERCGEQLLEEAQYCTSCGHDKNRIHKIWQTSQNTGRDRHSEDAWWNRPYFVVDWEPLRTTVYTKAEFHILMGLGITMFTILVVLGFVYAQPLFVVVFSPFLAVAILTFFWGRRRGEALLTYSIVDDVRLGPDRTMEDPEYSASQRKPRRRI